MCAELRAKKIGCLLNPWNTSQELSTKERQIYSGVNWSAACVLNCMLTKLLCIKPVEQKSRIINEGEANIFWCKLVSRATAKRQVPRKREIHEGEDG